MGQHNRIGIKGGKDLSLVQSRFSMAAPKLVVASEVMVTKIPRNRILPFFELGIESDMVIRAEYSRMLFQWKVYEKMNLLKGKEHDFETLLFRQSTS